MKDKKLKMLQVWEDTHEQIKEQAKNKGMSIRAYIQMLADKDRGKS